LAIIKKILQATVEASTPAFEAAYELVHVNEWPKEQESLIKLNLCFQGSCILRYTKSRHALQSL
jgi:hypothetical protein